MKDKNLHNELFESVPTTKQQSSDDFQPEELLKNVTETKHNRRYMEEQESEDQSVGGKAPQDNKASYQSNPLLSFLVKNSLSEQKDETSQSQVQVKASNPIPLNFEDLQSTSSKQSRLSQHLKPKLQIPKVDEKAMSVTSGGKRTKIHYLKKYDKLEKSPKRVEDIYAPRRDYITSVYQASKLSNNTEKKKWLSDDYYSSTSKTVRKYRSSRSSSEASSIYTPRSDNQTYTGTVENSGIWKKEIVDPFATDRPKEDSPKRIEVIDNEKPKKMQTAAKEKSTSQAESFVEKLNKKYQTPKVAESYDYEAKPVFMTESSQHSRISDKVRYQIKVL